MMPSVAHRATPPFRHRPGSDIALVTAKRAWTVGEIVDRARTLAAQLVAARATLLSGDGSARNCCFVLPSSDPAAFMIGLMACGRTRSVVVPWRDRTMPLDAVLDPIRPDAMIGFSADRAETCIEPLGGQRWAGRRSGEIIMMTSGSTGEPKGVALDYEQILLNNVAAGSMLEVWHCDGWAIDIDMALMSATCHMIMAWQFGLPLYHLGQFGSSEIDGVFGNRKLGFGGSPVQLVRLGDRLAADSAPAMMVSSGDFLTPAMIDGLLQRFPQSKIHKLYGLTELGGRFCCMPHDELMSDKAAVGRPLPGFAARLADRAPGDDIAEIEARTPLMAAGYYLPGGTFAPMPDRWFATGDIGRIDADGVVTVVGRADDVLKVGGEKVDRQTIEGALADILAGHDFCVLGVQHHLLGQVPALFIAPRPPAALPEWRAIVTHLRQTLPSRFMPGLMYRLDEDMPRLANGKIDRNRLKQTHHTLPRLS